VGLYTVRASDGARRQTHAIAVAVPNVCPSVTLVIRAKTVKIPKYGLHGAIRRCLLRGVPSLSTAEIWSVISLSVMLVFGLVLVS